MNAVTKAYPRDYKKPVILLHNNATLIDDENEKESLFVPFACMAHGIKIDMVSNKYGGKGGITVEGEIYLMRHKYNCICICWVNQEYPFFSLF